MPESPLQNSQVSSKTLQTREERDKNHSLRTPKLSKNLSTWYRSCQERHSKLAPKRARLIGVKNGFCPTVRPRRTLGRRLRLAHRVKRSSRTWSQMRSASKKIRTRSLISLHLGGSFTCQRIRPPTQLLNPCQTTSQLYHRIHTNPK